MRTISLLALSVLSAAAQAQELCFSCHGTWYVRASAAGKEQMIDNHAFGLCVDRPSMAITYDTEGSRDSKWRFTRKEVSLGTTYYYWNKEYDNGLFGRVTEQIEFSDVKQSCQYVARDKSGVAATAVNGQCTLTQRLGKS